MSKIKKVLRPIDYCPFPPNTPECDKWIQDYITKPLEGEEGEFALRPIDSCPFPPNTPERDKWIQDYITKPNLTLNQIGQKTTINFTSNPGQAIKAVETLEKGVKKQREEQTQGEE